MHKRILLEVELDRVSGQFASGEDIVQALIEEIDAADPGSVDIGESVYETQYWSATEVAGPVPPKQLKEHVREALRLATGDSSLDTLTVRRFRDLLDQFGLDITPKV